MKNTPRLFCHSDASSPFASFPCIPSNPTMTPPPPPPPFTLAICIPVHPIPQSAPTMLVSCIRLHHAYCSHCTHHAPPFPTSFYPSVPPCPLLHHSHLRLHPHIFVMFPHEHSPPSFLLCHAPCFTPPQPLHPQLSPPTHHAHPSPPTMSTCLTPHLPSTPPCSSSPQAILLWTPPPLVRNHLALPPHHSHSSFPTHPAHQLCPAFTPLPSLPILTHFGPVGWHSANRRGFSHPAAQVSN